MDHYTPKFKTAYEKVVKAAEEHGEEYAKIVFRDEMLDIGHDERIRNLYRIQDKLSRTAAFFKPNRSQEKYLRNRGKRNLILKCRQVGFTTLNCVRALDLVLWIPNMRTGILCHKQNVLDTIFNDITKFSYDWFKRDWGHLYSPIEKSSTANSLGFKEDGLGRALDSSIRVMFDFRGKTVHFIHVSEASRIEEERLIGSLNSVPDNGEITQETTANGQGGEFYRQWQLCKTKGQDAPYKAYFIPWFVHYPEVFEDYEPDSPLEYTPYELLLKSENPDVTDNHLLWRRRCIEDKCQGDIDKFENEYPTNDVDCFLTGQGQVYPSHLLKRQRLFLTEYQERGYLVPESGKMSLMNDSKGVVYIWDKPSPQDTYVIGSDPSGGVGKDNAAAYVKNQRTKRYVAKIWGDLDPADLGNELFKLGTYYNKAWINVEANNHGGTVLHVLKTLGYPNLYRRESWDEMLKKKTKKIGFLTTNDSKLAITEGLKNSLKNGNIKIQDHVLISEMTTYMQIASKNGKWQKREAAPGAKDDCVMAASLTEHMDQAMPRSTESISSSNPYNDLKIDSETGFPV